MASKNPLLATLIGLSGQRATIVIHKAMVEFTGDLTAGMMLSQLLYWTPRSTMEDGWIAKSDAEWMEELYIGRHSVRKAKDILEDMGLIETSLRQFKGIPTTHYRVLLGVLEQLWEEFIIRNQTMDYSISDNPLSDFRRTLTEITAETTTENPTVFGKQLAEARQNTPLVEGWSMLMRSQPGIKRAARLGNIQRHYETLFNSKCVGRGWKKFVEFVDDEEQKSHGEKNLADFAEWLKSQKGYDLRYYPYDKMMQVWNHAFVEKVHNIPVVIDEDGFAEVEK